MSGLSELSSDVSCKRIVCIPMDPYMLGEIQWTCLRIAVVCIMESVQWWGPHSIYTLKNMRRFGEESAFYPQGRSHHTCICWTSERRRRATSRRKGFRATSFWNRFRIEQFVCWYQYSDLETLTVQKSFRPIEWMGWFYCRLSLVKIVCFRIKSGFSRNGRIKELGGNGCFGNVA